MASVKKHRREIRRRYREGEAIKSIGDDLGFSPASIYHYITEEDKKNRTEHGGKIKYDKDEIISRYKNGESTVEIAEDLGCPACTVGNTLERHGVDRRSLSEANQRLDINHSAFSEITEESAYWIGFLMADGNVYYRSENSSRANLTLAWKDIAHLYKFRRFLNSEHKISTFTVEKWDDYYHGCRIQFQSNQICNDLAQHGIVPNKSLTAKVESDLKWNRHFWRGIVDGDGSVAYYNGSASFSLCGSENICEQFTDFCKNNLDLNLNVRECSDRNMYRVGAGWSTAEEIFDLLYEDSEVYLKRKYPFNN